MNQEAHVLIATKGFRLHSSQKASIDLWYQRLLSSPEKLAKWEEKLKKPTNKSGVKTLFFKNGNVRKENLYKFLKWYALDGELRKFQNQLKKGEKMRKEKKEKLFTVCNILIGSDIFSAFRKGRTELIFPKFNLFKF